MKGHAVLFSAFRRVADQLPDWKLRAVGPGVDDQQEVMQAAIEAANARELIQSTRITLEGPTMEPQTLLGQASALVISSLYGETSPLIGAEAAGTGIPVITSRVGNCADFADDPRFVVEPGSVSDLALSLIHI